jgi:predicted dehydrogenase
MKNDLINVGVIGCGNVAFGQHLPALERVDNINLLAASDINPHRLSRAKRKFHIQKAYPDYRDLLEDASLDVVGVFVPLEYHFKTASAVLDAEKHLFLEKPIAMSLKEADTLISKLSRTKKKAMAGFNYRWHPIIRQARKIIQSQELGSVELVNTIYTNWHDKRRVPEWRLNRKCGGGVVVECNIHMYDLWYFLFGSDIKEVYAVSKSKEGWDDTSSVVTARSKDGLLFSLTSSDDLANRHEMEAIGDKGVLHISIQRFDGLEFIPTSSCAGDMATRFRNAKKFVRQLPTGISVGLRGGGHNSGFRHQWQHFIDCIKQDMAVECTLEDGRRALQVVLATVESATKGQPVRISHAPDRIT